MFIRVRKSKKRFRLSLVETRRIDGKVCAEHVASLGSIALAMTVADRVEFWKALNGRLPGLANHINPDDLRAIAGAKVPAPSKMEVDVANLQEYAAAWHSVADFLKPYEPKPPTPMKAAMQRDSAAIKEGQLRDAIRREQMAAERIDRVLRGEDAGLKKPFSRDDPAFHAAMNKVGRLLSGHYLVPEEGQPSAFRALIEKFPDEVSKEMEAGKALDARIEAARTKRSNAAKRGWRRMMRLPSDFAPVRKCASGRKDL
jgi:hypothetical protein